MPSWPPPVASPAPRADETALDDASSRRRDERAVFVAACVGAIASTFVVVVVGLVLLALNAPEPTVESDEDSLVYLVWVFVAPIVFAPVFTWALATFGWRRMQGPSRGARACISLFLLAVPAMAAPGLIVDAFWAGADDVQSILVAASVVSPAIVGVLLTGRVLRPRHAALALGAIVVAAVAGFQYAAATTGERYQADIRSELDDTSLPYALPTLLSGWSATRWFADQRGGPYSEPGDDERWVAHLTLVGPGPTDATLEMWDAPANWYCADVTCGATDITVDGTQVLRYRGPDGWEHELLPRGEQLWVLSHPGPFTNATVEEAFAALGPVTLSEWVEAVAPLHRS